MPRRPAPSPLRLHDGPLPSRAVPKHTLPSFPRPCFYPAATVAQGPAPRAHAVPSELDDILPRPQLAQPAPPALILPAERLRSGSSSPSSGGSAPSAWRREGAVRESREKVLRGPWDHSSSIRVPLNVDAMLAPPRPVAVNPVSVW